MKSKLPVIVLAFICYITPSVAQNDLKIVLKDGSEMNGYISRQRPGEDISFTSSKANILLPSAKVKSIVDNDIKISSLSPEWIEWAEANEAFIGLGENRTLVLSDIITDDGTINRVRILERGAKVRYLELSSNVYSLEWEAIDIVRAEKRPKLLLSGINRSYKLTSGMEYEGQYVEEIPGKTMSLYRDNGVVEVFKTEDVIKDCRYKINPNQAMLEQSDLIDIVIVKEKNSERSISYRGIIFERSYSESDDITNDYLLIQLENGSTMSINLADIIEYRKEPNPKYAPIMDVILNVGDFMVNRQLVESHTSGENDNVITINTDNLTVVDKGLDKTDIAIETNFNEPSQSQQYKLVHVHKYYDKKAKHNFYGFTYEDIVKTPMLAKNIETSVNNTTKMEFSLLDEGIYVFYNPITKQAVPFRVK